MIPLSAFGFALVSALIPFLPIELYLAGLGAKNYNPYVVGTAAAAGATLGKVVLYELSRRGAESQWFKKKLEKPSTQEKFVKWSDRMNGRPAYCGGLLLVSSFSGFPPLFILTIAAGAVRFNRVVFALTTFIGRAARFVLIVYGVDFAFH